MMKHERFGLYDPANEHDACGVGMAVSRDGTRSHKVVEYGLALLRNMAHRGAENADGLTGDGSGITVQVPHGFIRSIKVPVPEAGRYGTGLVFLPRDDESAGRYMDLLRSIAAEEVLSVIAERDVPVDSSVIGPMAAECEPRIVQIFVTSYDSPEVLEKKLFAMRKKASNRIAALGEEHSGEFYICSLSSRTMVYKGMLTPEQLGLYFKDLSDPAFDTAVAMVHSRFSTNTLPAWKLAQPFRMLCHNGEINTIRANRMWMKAREGMMVPGDVPEMEGTLPIVQPGMSDSASLDNVFEYMTMSGMSMPNALSVLVPESWNDKNPIPDSLKAYYEYNSILMEPWDGPAAILFTDGRFAGGTLDRNGLRPVRYTVTRDGMVFMASEAGVIRVEKDNVKETGRLRPGKMMLIDTSDGSIRQDAEIKSELASAAPYRDWLEMYRLDLKDLSSGRQVERTVPDYRRRLNMFSYSTEDVSKVMMPMITQSKEGTGSTGWDIPLAVLSDRPQLLFSYFKQRFAQVTNPPIDPIREELVMSTMGYIGGVSGDIVRPESKLCRAVKARHPIITNRELDLLRNLEYRGFGAVTVPTTFTASEGLGNALARLCAQAEAAVDSGAEFVILSDRSADQENIPMPSLLALSAVNQHLISCGKRLGAALVVESGEPREVMHFALLIGYGASAVNPYMAFAVIQDLVDSQKVMLDADTAESHYVKACDKGLLKIMSKMGIATMRSYRGSALFDIIGLSEEVTRTYFGEESSIGGAGLRDIADTYARLHDSAYDYDADALASDKGEYANRKDGERHSWSPESVRMLRNAVRGDSKTQFDEFSKIEDEGRFFIRNCMDIASEGSVPEDEVEPAASIMKRFVEGAISFGAISKEAHETIAEAMNSFGSQSNTGEGGEDPSRFVIQKDGRNLRSAVKQVASGRFGVTAEYLVNADELQIKVAQGAKPGEGGQLMGYKVDPVIAAIRHTIPGITLISPPPHHDIYSIEDLKQLIFDLKCINPRARISVKLVSEGGVGTVAAGVVKAGADMILISGGDGGTGASTLSSLRYAGSPWEVGLAEVQQTLMLNGLRGRVRIQVDGQMKTARDVIVAALLGADEFGFATAPMVAMGCVMCRKCHTNTCPAGIATQDPEKRARFASSAEELARYFRYLAEDVRSQLAHMGFRSVSEIVGRADLLKASADSPIDISKLTAVAGGDRTYTTGQPDILSRVFDRRIIEDSAEAVRTGRHAEFTYRSTNVDRSIGTMLSGEIVRAGDSLADGTLDICFEGAVGQSFGAFLTKGVTFRLDGLANDYVGKGLSGGRIIVTNNGEAPEGNVIAGNTLMYGATSGELYVAGSVGERFCVRNSGATAVSEGAGDHCCEYMTGGRVVVLGSCGRNFAAGMSAGIAYVLDENGDFDRHCNMDMVELTLVKGQDAEELRTIIGDHLRYTGSSKARSILDDWDSYLPMFRKVMPVGYKLLLEKESE